MNTMDLQVSGPEQIRAAFTAAIDATSEHTGHIDGLTRVLTEAADWYESLQMAGTTVAHLRDAATALTAGSGHLSTAAERLQAAAADFDARDGHVAAAVAETGNLMDPAGYCETLLLPAPAAARPPREATMNPTDPGSDTETPNGAASGPHAASPAVLDAEAGDEPTAQAKVQSGGMTLPGGEYLDWSSTDDDGHRHFELGDGLEPGSNALALELTPAQQRDLLEQLNLTLTDNDQANHFVTMNQNGHSYIDWSTPRAGGGRQLVVAAEDGSAVEVDLTRDELQALHHQLVDDLDAEQAPGQPSPAPDSLEDRVLAAYDDLSKRPGGPVNLADLRDSLGSVDKDEVDRVLLALDDADLIQLEPEVDQAGMTDRDRSAAVVLARRKLHVVRRVVRFDDDPQPTAPQPAVVDQLRDQLVRNNREQNGAA